MFKTFLNKKFKFIKELNLPKSYFRISLKTVVEVLAGIWINLTSGWFGALLIAPRFFGSDEDYFQLLIANLPSGIFGLSIALILTEKGKKL